jgi:enoyl-CoA hydratase/carnithine racemase
MQLLVCRCESDIQISVLMFTLQGKYFSAGLDFGVLMNLKNKQTMSVASENELERTANFVAKNYNYEFI